MLQGWGLEGWGFGLAEVCSSKGCKFDWFAINEWGCLICDGSLEGGANDLYPGYVGRGLIDLSKLGKRKHTPPCSSAELFFAEKDFGGRHGFLGFHRGFCIHHRPGKFFFEARKVPQKIFFW